MENKQAIIDLAVDLSRGSVTQFSADEANETLRKALNDLTGVSDGEYDYKKFRKNKLEVFEIVEEVLDIRLNEGIGNTFDRFVDFRNTAFGDKLSFRSPIKELFRVDSIAGGTNNLRRQRIGQDELVTIETGWYGVKIYEGLERFLAGRVDWVGLIDNVEQSFNVKITEDIFTTVKAAYTGITAPFSHTGSWDLDEFNKIVEHVRASTGLTPMVIGTRMAVSKALPNSNYISDAMKDARNRTGFFETVEGVEFGIIPQAHKIGTFDFAIDDDFLLILPNGNEKMIKFVMEGQTLIKEVADQSNADDSQEYTVRKKYGTAVLSGDIYGVYILE